jgi:hypothetical protein
MAKNLIPSGRLPLRACACAAAALLICACQDVPKYKRSAGHFPEWSEYEGKNFRPISCTVAGVDPVGNSITVIAGKRKRTFAVTSDTRIMHNGDDVPLASVPINQGIKISVSPDGQTLLSIWYGTHSNASMRAGNLSHRR